MAHPQNGETVKVHYTGKFSDGEVFDSSRDRDPLEFTIGKSGVIPGFEAAVVTLTPGESKTVTIPADQAYGPKMDHLVFDIEREKLPNDLVPQVGMQLAISSNDGKHVPVWILEISENKVTLDGNHPLAGKDLTFELELVEII